MTDVEPPRDRWVRLLNRARDELIQMYTYRFIYREVGRIIDENGTLPPSEFFALVQSSYQYMQAIAVRRQVDRDGRVETLGRVLHEIGESADTTATEGLNLAAVQADADRIKSETAVVRAYVNQSLAHSDASQPSELATLADVHAAIDLLGETFQRLYAQLTGEYWELEAAIQYNWLEVFTVPWIVRSDRWRGDDDSATAHTIDS